MQILEQVHNITSLFKNRFILKLYEFFILEGFGLIVVWL